jgi:farnesyl-diphosphate farnesyltransferase
MRRPIVRSPCHAKSEPGLSARPAAEGVSRSFYLTLRILPEGMRDPVGLAYLLARAADTIADTSLIPPVQRLDLLLALRQHVNGTQNDGSLAQRLSAEVASQQTQSDEKVLLESIGPALGVLSQLDASDRTAVRGIVDTLTEGMEFDLRTFPDERSARLPRCGRWTSSIATRISWPVAWGSSGPR